MVDTKQQLEFYQFWQLIAREVGSARLKISGNATSIHNLIASNSDAKDFLHAAIRDSYKRSHCNNLFSAINLDSVLDILGETAYELRNNHRDDLFDIELLEEIVWHISLFYPKSHQKSRSASKGSIENNQGNESKVISFPNYKIRRANTRL